MIAPPLPRDEHSRLERLRILGLLDRVVEHGEVVVNRQRTAVARPGRNLRGRIHSCLRHGRELSRAQMPHA